MDSGRMFRALGPSPAMVYEVFRVLMLFPSLDSSAGLNSTKKGTLLFEQSRLLGLEDSRDFRRRVLSVFQTLMGFTSVCKVVLGVWAVFRGCGASY